MDRRRPLIYLVAGGINTGFSYVSTLLLLWLLTPALHTFVVGMIATAINLTFSFTTYKLFVFKTKGRWFEEYLKSVAVYGAIGILTSAGLWLLIDYADLPAWLAQGLLTVVVVVLSYTGHSLFTFNPAATLARRTKPEAQR